MNAESVEKLKALNFPIRIEFDEKDKLFIAEFLDLPGCSASGETVEEAYSRAQEAKEEWLRVTLEQGLPIPKPSTSQEYSGRILVRLPASLHGMLSDRAQLHGASLNQFIVHLLSAAAVGDEVSTKIDELRDYVSKLERRVAKLSQTLNQLLSRTAQATSRATTAEVFVKKHPDGWAVTKPNAERASAVYPTQAEAIRRAREIADGGPVHIQGRHGKFRPETAFDE